jgi:hypothetical protein
LSPAPRAISGGNDPMRLLTLSVFCLFALTATAIETPSTTVIKAAAKKQPPVPFAHAKHATKLAKTCDTCHHTQKGLTEKSTVKVETCTSCHLDPRTAEIPSMREMSMAKNPFHIVCIACHKEQKKGPVACTGCHVKAT